MRQLLRSHKFRDEAPSSHLCNGLNNTCLSSVDNTYLRDSALALAVMAAEGPAEGLQISKLCKAGSCLFPAVSHAHGRRLIKTPPPNAETQREAASRPGSHSRSDTLTQN